MGKLDGKVALVTGGTSGIGLATAKQFVHEGAYVFITGRRGAELAAAVEEIGRNVTGVRGDVSNVADVERLFAQIKQEKGKLDIVFANAGVVRYAALGAISEEFFDSIFDTNVKGALFTVQKALPLLPNGASIILSASMVGSKGLLAYSVYSAWTATVTGNVSRSCLNYRVVFHRCPLILAASNGTDTECLPRSGAGC